MLSTNDGCAVSQIEDVEHLHVAIAAAAAGRICGRQRQAIQQLHVDSGVPGHNSGLMQAVPAAETQPSAVDAPSMPKKVGFMSQHEVLAHEEMQQFQAQMPSAGNCYDNYFMDQPWQDVCFVPVGCTAIMDQLLDQLQAGSGACSSSQPLQPAPDTSSDGSRSSNSSRSQARAAAAASVPESPGAASSARLCSTDACTSVPTDAGAALGRTWCVMELPPDCMISFESDSKDAPQQLTAQQRVVPSGAAAVGTSSQLVCAAYHTLPACGDFAESWLGCSTLAATATAAPQREQQLHVHLLQQQLQQQLGVDDSYDSLAALPLDNPYKDSCGVRSNWAAGVECFVGEF